MTTSTPSQSSPSYAAIKLGIDAHAQYYWVSRRVDGATPPPVQKMTYDELPTSVRVQTAEAHEQSAPVLNSPTPNPAAKKKAVVAIARQLAVDLWRVFTGQVGAEKFGLVYLPEAA